MVDKVGLLAEYQQALECISDLQDENLKIRKLLKKCVKHLIILEDSTHSMEICQDTEKLRFKIEKIVN